MIMIAVVVVVLHVCRWINNVAEQYFSQLHVTIAVCVCKNVLYLNSWILKNDNLDKLVGVCEKQLDKSKCVALKTF